jgi:peroxiredoxin (alkyl hydroperoxide reductase subunit C)
MIRVGDTIPGMEIDGYVPDEFKSFNLADYRGKWLVLMFYPADFTFICPTELKEAQDYYERFKAQDAEVMSISTDTKFTHKAWHDSSDAIGAVQYPMLADPTGAISRQFGTYIEEDGLSWRATFIIDPDGVVKHMEVHDNSIGRSAREILRRLMAAKYVRENDGEVCPASWEPGADTLTPGVDLVGKI